MYLAAGTFLYVTRGLRKKRKGRRVTVPCIETCGETGGIQTRFNNENLKTCHVRFLTSSGRLVWKEMRVLSIW